MKRVLLVGGAGFVGAVLAQELLERGYAVRVLDRMYFGEAGLKATRDRLEVVMGDMRRVPDDALQNVSAVINVGGLSNDPTAEYNPKANYEMNTLASVQLARRCRELGIRRYIYASSCSIYDQGVTDEARDVLLDETSEVDPQASYSSSKYAAEKELLPLADSHFCTVALRKGTVYGFSPRMRYDLVVNTFVKDALSKGEITIHFGGEMWRPLVDVRDAARAYVTLLQADAALINGQVFNLVHRNYRISELALRVREALNGIGVKTQIKTEYAYKGIRNYRVSGHKMESVLGFRPAISVEDSVQHMVRTIRECGYTDYDNPRYYNIRWMRLLEEAQHVLGAPQSVFDVYE